MQPRPNLPPRPNISLCPKCRRPKSPKEVSCPHCGIRSCPRGHILNSKVCSVCGWQDLNFKQPATASKTGPVSSEFDETTTHRIEYECPNCHSPVDHMDVKCPTCGLLGGWQYKGVRGKMPPFARASGGVTSSSPQQYSEPSVDRRSPLKEAASSQLRDVAPKKWIQKGVPPVESAPAREKRGYQYGEWKKRPERTPKFTFELSKGQVLVATRIAALIVCVAAIILVIINIGNIQSAISALPKPTLPKPPAADVTPPKIEKVLVSEVTESNVVITWVTDEPATSQVEYGTTADYGNSTALGEDLLTAHKVKLDVLKPSTSYHYRVKSKDASGNPAISSIAGTFTTAAPPDTTPPVISGVKIADVSDSTVTITWVTDEKATSQIEYGTTKSYGSTISPDNSLVANHSVTLSGLEPDKTYYFRVKSTDGSKNESLFDASQSFKTLPPVPTGPEVGKRAPDFTVYTLDGAPVTLSKLRGKIVMVNFWAAGCGACVAEMPDIQAVYKTWSGPQKLEVLAINAGDHEIYVRNIIAEEKWTLPIFIDPDRAAVRGYEISRIPRTFFVDTNGIIRKIELGRFDNQDQIKEALNSLQ